MHFSHKVLILASLEGSVTEIVLQIQSCICRRFCGRNSHDILNLGLNTVLCPHQIIHQARVYVFAILQQFGNKQYTRFFDGSRLLPMAHAFEGFNRAKRLIDVGGRLED